MDERGFGITTEVSKGHWMSRPVVKITITDGQNNVVFYDRGSFTIETDKPFPEPLIRKDES